MPNDISYILVIFIMYCFLGWVWESLYTSVLARKWTNRGFLYGPAIPIYGFGALAILLLTEPFKHSLVLTYLSGGLAATLLEYFTGVLMEKIFGVRYWDYSDKPLNLNGHISFTVSLAWGGFALILVRFIHPWLKGFLVNIPEPSIKHLSYLLIAIFAVDVTLSAQAALDMKNLLTSLTENNMLLQDIRKAINDVLANMSHVGNGSKSALSALRDEVDDFKQKMGTYALENKENMAVFLAKLEQKLNASIQSLKTKSSKSDTIKEVEPLDENSKIIHVLSDIRNRLDLASKKARAITPKQIKTAYRIIKSNPKFLSKHFKLAFEEVKKWFNLD